MLTFALKEVDSFLIIGIQVRTTNKHGLALAEIGELWEYFMSDDIGSKIPNKICEDIYCLYTDYESDATGLYTAILGKKVSSLDEVPVGMVCITVPQQKCRVYTSKGKLSDCLKETWMQIWEEDIERAFSVDFDVYGEKAFDPEDAEVLTYLSVK